MDQRIDYKGEAMFGKYKAVVIYMLFFICVVFNSLALSAENTAILVLSWME